MRVDRDSPKPANGQQTPDRPSTEDGPAPNSMDDFEQTETIPNGPNQFLNQFRELGEYLSYFVTAKIDIVKLSLRHVVLWVVLASLGIVAVGGLIVIASWLTLSGIAEALGGLFGNRPWVGNFITGSVLLAGLGLGLYCTVVQWNRFARERTAEKYERRQARQQAQFGRHVADPAATTTPQKK